MTDDLLTNFRSEVPVPDEATAQRLYALVTRKQELKPRRFRPRRPRLRVAVAVSLVIAAVVFGTIAAAAPSTLFGPPVPPQLRHAHVLNAGFAGDDVWAWTARGLELSSATGGEWRDITPSGLHAIRAAYFFDAYAGWVADTGPTEGSSAPLLVYRTSDAGVSWQVSTVGRSALFADASRGSAWFAFVDPLHGWLEVQDVSGAAFSDANLYRTTNGGASWTPLRIPIAGALTFISRHDGFVLGGVMGNELYATRDGGGSWERVELPGVTNGNGWIYGPVFKTPEDGILSVTTTRADRTTIAFYGSHDAGSNWTKSAAITEGGNHGQATTPVASLGAEWLAATPARTLDRIGSGATRAVTPTGLPSNRDLWFVNLLGFPRGSETVLALYGGGECEGSKSDCFDISALLVTHDGGSTWSQLSP